MTTTPSKKGETTSPHYQPQKTKDSFELMELSAININEAKEEYILCATASGLRREDFYVSVDKKIITIVAGGKDPYFKNTVEQNLSEQVRTLTLPDDADPLLTAATYTNGSLEIHIPKGENTEEKPLLIHVY